MYGIPGDFPLCNNTGDLPLGENLGDLPLKEPGDFPLEATDPGEEHRCGSLGEHPLCAPVDLALEVKVPGDRPLEDALRSLDDDDCSGDLPLGDNLREYNSPQFL